MSETWLSYQVRDDRVALMKKWAERRAQSLADLAYDIFTVGTVFMLGDHLHTTLPTTIEDCDEYQINALLEELDDDLKDG